jgi:hypothetical protein
MQTAREHRQRLAREIETKLRRRRIRQVCFVVAGAALLSAVFILGRAFMPMIPTTPESSEAAQAVDTSPLPASLSMLAGSGGLAALGLLSLGIAHLLKERD